MDLQKYTKQLREPGRKVESIFEHKGYVCAVLIMPMGFRCGYVHIPKEHELYGKHYRDLEDIDVHGGLTFSGSLDRNEERHWIGFDCHHWGDACDESLMEEGYPHVFCSSGVVRSQEYVQNEIKSMVDQIIEKYS